MLASLALAKSQDLQAGREVLVIKCSQGEEASSGDRQHVQSERDAVLDVMPQRRPQLCSHDLKVYLQPASCCTSLSSRCWSLPKFQLVIWWLCMKDSMP